MITVIAWHKKSGATLLAVEGHAPDAICGWMTGFTAALHALYGGEASVGSGVFVKTIPTDVAKKLLRPIRRLSRKNPEEVVLQERHG